MFEYTSKDKPFLNKDIKMRLLFMFLFLIVFAWQIVSIVFSALDDNLSNMMLGIGVFVCIMALIFVLICLLYINRSSTALRQIKKEGHAFGSVLFLMNSEKNSFIRLYSLISKILALIMSLVLISAITYFVLQIVYLSTYSFYMPILFLFAVCGLNSVYHISYEIKTAKEVEKANNHY